MVSGLGAIGAGALGGGAVTIFISAVDKFSKTFQAANAGLLKLGAGITAIGVAGAFAVGGLLKIAGGFEQTQIAFKTMMGSAEDAQAMLKELADFAAKTPFTIPEVEQNAKMLMAMSIETEKILPTLKALGDVASGLNVPMSRLALNFGQVKVQGKLTGRELRDFAVAGVPLIAELSKNLGVAEETIKEMVSAGDIGFAEVEKAFMTMTGEGGKFFDLMDAQSKTFLGQVSNIQDSFIKIARIMGEVFLPAAKWVAERLAVLVGWFEQHPKLTKFAAVVLGVVTALALVIGPILILIGLFPVILSGFAAATAAIGIASGAVMTFATTIWAALGPIGLIVIALAAVVAISFSQFNKDTETAAERIFGIGANAGFTAGELEKFNTQIRISIDLLNQMAREQEQLEKFGFGMGQGTVMGQLPGMGGRGMTQQDADKIIEDQEKFIPVFISRGGRDVTNITIEGSLIQERDLINVISEAQNDKLNNMIITT